MSELISPVNAKVASASELATFMSVFRVNGIANREPVGRYGVAAPICSIISVTLAEE
jgi:hypothetical protein